MNKNIGTLLLGVVIGAGSILGIESLSTPAVANTAALHAFTIRQDPSFASAEEIADGGVHYYAEPYGHVFVPDGGVIDLAGVASPCEVSRDLIAPVEAAILECWKQQKGLAVEANAGSGDLDSGNL